LKARSFEFKLETKGEIEIIDITDKIREYINKSGIKNGIALIFTPGSTAAIATIEYEPNLIEDFKNAINKLISKGMWRHPINAHSHLRATLLSQSLSIPIVNGEPALGTWQQVVFIEFDTRPRNRRVIIQILGAD